MLLTFGLDEVRDWLHAYSSTHDIIPDLLQLAQRMAPNDWLILLGDFWIGFDKIGAHVEALASAITHCGKNPALTINEMMDASERQAFELLPEVITIYRGCGLENRSGCSWTLDRWVAERVPFVQRYATEVPMLLTASIHKGAVAALKLGRLGREVIVFELSEKDWTEEVITALSPRS